MDEQLLFSHSKTSLFCPRAYSLKCFPPIALSQISNLAPMPAEEEDWKKHMCTACCYYQQELGFLVCSLLSNSYKCIPLPIKKHLSYLVFLSRWHRVGWRITCIDGVLQNGGTTTHYCLFQACLQSSSWYRLPQHVPFLPSPPLSHSQKTTSVKSTVGDGMG